VPDEDLHFAVYIFFDFVKLSSIIFKHIGFKEENEWRIIYVPDRDVNHILNDRFSYIIGDRGVEPKLKFELKPLPIESAGAWKFPDIVNRIVLGPTVSSPLALASTKRMLASINRLELIDKVFASSIPLRPR
jgi:hypothetical protein